MRCVFPQVQHSAMPTDADKCARLHALHACLPQKQMLTGCSLLVGVQLATGRRDPPEVRSGLRERAPNVFQKSCKGGRQHRGEVSLKFLAKLPWASNSQNVECRTIHQGLKRDRKDQ